mmetsp:Transcript_13415/g.17568  ORF Transcript_13415/g.17568 Transcript_13415/m.17568 type:complete len:121 (+) Transcript_13415:79-441(+)
MVKSKKNITKYVLDCTAPVDDKIIDLSSFEKYLHDRIKVDGKTGNLENVSINRDRTKITISASIPLSKRQLKFLTKRYLKKQQLRDYLRVVANSKNSYELKYFSLDSGDAEDDEDEDMEE